MMSPEEFEVWAKDLNLTEETVKEIQMIRNSPPSRRVGGGKNNVSGRYSSRKMGATIQFESHKVELPAIYTMEFDDNIIEYYDQPPSIKVNYNQSTKIGKKVFYLYTPDFFVIEKQRAYWVEWKREEELIKLSQEKPDRFFIENDCWVYAPGRNYSERFDLGFFVRSSKEINWTLQRNLIYLEDYITKEYNSEESTIKRIKEIILSSPGLTIAELIQSANSQFSNDDIYSLIVKNVIYVDLYNSLIKESKDVNVFLNKEQYKSFSILREPQRKLVSTNKIDLKYGNKILWGEKAWSILNHDNKQLFLLSEDNTHTHLPINVFESYIAAGYIKGSNAHEENISSEIKTILSQITEDDLKVANEKYEHVTKYLNGERNKLEHVTDRTMRNWIKKYKDAEKIHGNGYIGLIPSNKKKGNRRTKISLDTLELMNNMITNSYQTIKQKTAKAVYREFIVKCEELNLYPPSYQTFCETLKKRSVYDLEISRKGARAAYKYEQIYIELEMTTPKHGERVFEIAHIDHTELDIELVIDNKEISRPWCTFMIDAYSRRVLACYITFEEPSTRTCMMVIRECVRKYNRLPSYLVVDGGREFRSIYFESLLALYGIHKKERPTAKARFGTVIERLFGTTNKLFIHNLSGNTQIMKNVRQVTKSVNPKNYAVWTLESLYERLNGWIDEVYDNLENPSLNKTPKAAYEESITSSGSRTHTYIPYDETFILMTLPSPKGSIRKVYPGKGIKLTYLYYWNEKFRNPKVENSSVEVRYDPFNIGIAYAFINNRWERCLSEQFSILKGKTEKQIKLITEEIKQRKKLQSSNSVISAKMIGRYILELEEIEDKLSYEKYKPIEAMKPLIEIENKMPEQNQIHKETGNSDEDKSDDEEFEFYGELL